ncbi:MAG: BrnA antitoxin family protein [Rhodospirillaceae bacterium]
MNHSLIDDDAPEADDEWFVKARLASEFLPSILSADIVTEMLKPRGRPRSIAPKKLVSLRLDADLVERMRSTGVGWQSRANDILRKSVGM